MAFLTDHDRTYKTPEDICAHLGDDYARFEGAIVPPLFQNSLFVQPTEVNGITDQPYAYTKGANLLTWEMAQRVIRDYRKHFPNPALRMMRRATASSSRPVIPGFTAAIAARFASRTRL